MEREVIIEKFKEVLKPYTQNLDALNIFSEETSIVNDLKVNSSHMVDVFLDTEEEFGIEIDNESLEKIQNFKDAIDMIEQKLKEQTVAE